MSLLFTNVDRQHFTDREPYTPYWSDCFNHPFNECSESYNNKKKLVICYGDSWTWGDSLGSTNSSEGIDDREFRLSNIYAHHLAMALDADFVNCAIPGIFNYWIHDRLQILINHDIKRLAMQYENIYIIVTLTELGRDFEFKNYIDDFRNFFDWSNATGQEILIQAEKFDFIKLRNIEDQLPNNCHLIIGRNFTNTQPENQHILKNLLPQNWCDILFKKQNILPIPNVLIMSHGISTFDSFIESNKLNSEEYKKWMLEFVLTSANQQIDLLNKSVYNYKKASKHPTPEGHILWAEYLTNYINGLNYDTRRTRTDRAY